MTVYVGIRNLEFSVDIPTSLKGKALGLLGNFDGVKMNDFILPNKTQLANGSVDTEREILDNFANPCKLSIFFLLEYIHSNQFSWLQLRISDFHLEKSLLFFKDKFH